ncbi:MAG TPA: hypothetical protein PK413_04800 [Thermoanaerobaculia bacterium]|nr:hypothetical protein [Thermoanaerobaculia bacterium]
MTQATRSIAAGDFKARCLALLDEVAKTGLPLTAEMAIEAGCLGRDGFHGDPADRLIVATARCLRAPLITKDPAIRDFAGAHSIW